MINKYKQIIKNKRFKSGFTLIEMLVVLVVVALLMAIIIPNVAGQRSRIDEQAKENITEIIITQAETYRLVEGPAEEPVTVTLLHSSGYITEKQMDEALKYFQGGIIDIP